MIDHGTGVPAGADGGYGKYAASYGYPAGYPYGQLFMIMKELHSIAMKSLGQEQILRDLGDAIEVDYLLNPKFRI